MSHHESVLACEYTVTSDELSSREIEKHDLIEMAIQNPTGMPRPGSRLWPQPADGTRKHL